MISPCGDSLQGQEINMSMAELKTAPVQQKVWYVMHHLNPEVIEQLLQQENAWRRQQGKSLYEYFVPYRFLPRAVPDQYAKDAKEQTSRAAESNTLRSTLRHFVFVKATDQEITALVDRPWNREGCLHLLFYRTKSGQRITMSDKMMTPFITLCCENRQRFSFGPPIEQVETHDVVIISKGLFKDFEATVVDVQHTAEGISMTLGIPMFGGEKTLLLKDYRFSDLNMPRSVEQLLDDQFIDHVEDALLGIIRSRLKGRETVESRRDDVITLNRLYHYSYVYIQDVPSRSRFRALMLLCATLRGDEEGRQSLIAEVQTLLQGITEATTDTEAYLMAVLYVATGNADYRTVAKHYRQQHAEVLGPHSPLTRIMPLVTRLNKSFFKNNNIH